MKKKSGEFVFKDRNKLLEMLSLRRQGWTFVSLSELYNCDRTSLRYQCRKYQIFPDKTKFIKNSNEVFSPDKILTSVIITLYPREKKNWTIIDGERVNLGKSYAEYLQEISPYKNKL